MKREGQANPYAFLPLNPRMLGKRQQRNVKSTLDKFAGKRQVANAGKKARAPPPSPNPNSSPSPSPNPSPNPNPNPIPNPSPNPKKARPHVHGIEARRKKNAGGGKKKVGR